MLTILRWWANEDPTNKNQIFSRTLGKIAFVAQGQNILPKAEEFWLCDVTQEIYAGQVKGCFLVTPIEQVEYKKLMPLNANNCTLNIYYLNYKNESTKGKATIVVTPEMKNESWILSLESRSRLKDPDVIAIVVNLGGEFWKLN